MDNIKYKTGYRIANCADPQLQTQLIPANQTPATPPLSAPGPFQVFESLSETDSTEVECVNLGELSPGAAPQRKYDCVNYESCLELAAALNWDSFTCRGCNEEVNCNLVWRAHQAKRHDAIASSLCEHLPVIGVHSSELKKHGDASDDSIKPEVPPTDQIKIG